MWLFGLEAAKYITSHGYIAVALLVGMESIGIPLPGETALLTASVLAGATKELQIQWVIVAAAGGAIVGDTIGYLIGRTLGFALLKRWGPRVGLTESRLKVGRYLFAEHGGVVVFFGRFISLLRTLTAVMAGANRMPWPRFFLFNAAGGIVWATVYGLGAYYAGGAIHRINGPLGLALTVAGIAVLAGGMLFLKRHEKALTDAAEKAYPGPLF